MAVANGCALTASACCTLVGIDLAASARDAVDGERGEVSVLALHTADNTASDGRAADHHDVVIAVVGPPIR